MPAYARNHYLAVSHLRRFCRPDGKIVVSQRDPQEPTCERKPESAGYGKYWYGRTRRKEKEEALKIVEDEAIEWMSQIEKSGITPDFHNHIYRWSALLWTSCQLARGHAGKQYSEAAKAAALASEQLKEEQIEEWGEQWFGLVTSLTTHRALHGYDLMPLLVEAPDGQEFVISDHGVVGGVGTGLPSPMSAGLLNGGFVDWGWPGVFLEAPLSLHHTLCWYDGYMFEPVRTLEQGRLKATPREVQTMRWRQCCQASYQVFGAHAAPEIWKPNPAEHQQESIFRPTERFSELARQCQQAGVPVFTAARLATGICARTPKLYRVAEKFQQELDDGTQVLAQYPAYVTQALQLDRKPQQRNSF